jgi:hypothetical protein
MEDLSVIFGACLGQELDPIRVMMVERVLGLCNNAIVSVPADIILSCLPISGETNKVSDLEFCASFYVHATPPACGKSER